MKCHIAGIGLCGPGLADWTTAKAVLVGQADYHFEPTILPATDLLPPNERRRAAPAVKLALVVAQAALSGTGLDPRDVPSVFASSGGDGETVHAILETLAGQDRDVSPTRFHNSVHNAPSGYWSIATGCQQATTSLCAFDGSFAAGLLDAFALMAELERPVLLVAYDSPYPAPLSGVRNIAEAFGMALLLSPHADSGPGLEVQLSTHRLLLPSGRKDAALGALEFNNPAARSLPLLQLLASGRSGPLALEYLPGCHVGIEVTCP